MTGLVVFAHENLAELAESLGLAAVLVDLETHGKHERQDGFDTQITAHTLGDLKATRAATRLPVICRVDSPAHLDPQLVEDVIVAGADEILVAMVRGPDDIAAVRTIVDGRVAVGAMIETAAALNNAPALAELGLSRVFVGLHDLLIERRAGNLFDPLIDGTVDQLARTFADTPFGVAGATHPQLGHPLNAELLMNEISRVGADFTFLRRSFFDALIERPAHLVVEAIQHTFATAAHRTAAAVEQDHAVAVAAIKALSGANPRSANAPSTNPPGRTGDIGP